jgi:hypothetical protein
MTDLETRKTFYEGFYQGERYQSIINCLEAIRKLRELPRYPLSEEELKILDGMVSILWKLNLKYQTPI